MMMTDDVNVYIEEFKARAQAPMVAFIREEECIGCMKCIKACPVDSIVGAVKLMHTVIADVCTGCELCVEPCPVDCIDMLPAEVMGEGEFSDKVGRTRVRFRGHAERVVRVAEVRRLKRVAGAPSPQPLPREGGGASDLSVERKAFVVQALARVRAKKGDKS